MPTLREMIGHQRLIDRLRKKRSIHRRPRAPRPPVALELSYQGELRHRANVALQVAKQVLEPRLERIARQANSRVRHDAWPDDLDQAFKLLRATYFNLFPDDQLQRLAEEYARKVSVFNKADLAAIIHKAVGVDVFLGDRHLQAASRAFVSQNVKLITSIPVDYYEDLEQRLIRGLRTGTRVEDLMEMIEDRYAVPAARAELIARDQVGKFNGELMRERQSELGINRYTWRTAGDEKVREMHADLEGEVFTWGDPPVTNPSGDKNEPGGDYQCRCTGEPMLEDLLL